MPLPLIDGPLSTAGQPRSTVEDIPAAPSPPSAEASAPAAGVAARGAVAPRVPEATITRAIAPADKANAMSAPLPIAITTPALPSTAGPAKPTLLQAAVTPLSATTAGAGPQTAPALSDAALPVATVPLDIATPTARVVTTSIQPATTAPVEPGTVSTEPTAPYAALPGVLAAQTVPLMRAASPVAASGPVSLPDATPTAPARAAITTIVPVSAMGRATLARQPTPSAPLLDPAPADPRFRSVPASVRQQWALAARERPRLSAGNLAKNRLVDSLQRRMVATFGQLGVRIMAGSDAGSGTPNLFHGGSLHDELERLVAIGLTPAEALRAGTVNAAMATGRGFDLGRIHAGYLADVVLLNGNPLDDIRNLRLIQAVVLRGRLFDLPALAGLATEAEQATIQQNVAAQKATAIR